MVLVILCYKDLQDNGYVVVYVYIVNCLCLLLSTVVNVYDWLLSTVVNVYVLLLSTFVNIAVVNLMQKQGEVS